MNMAISSVVNMLVDKDLSGQATLFYDPVFKRLVAWF